MSIEELTSVCAITAVDAWQKSPSGVNSNDIALRSTLIDGLFNELLDT